MPSGGARLRSGSAKEQGSLRRDRDGFEFLRLPASGREGEPPSWPTSHARPTARMKRVWIELWRLPQAIAWEAEHLEEQVAWYTRCLCIAEGPKSTSQDRNKIPELMGQLGLTLDGLHKNGWQIGEVEQTADERPTGTEGPVTKERFRVVTGGR